MKHSLNIKKKHIACIGATNIDYKCYLQHKIYSSPTNNVYNPTHYVGGVARNIAENLARMNFLPILISCVGDDEKGKKIINETSRVGVNTEGVWVLPNQTTSSYTVFLDKDGSIVQEVRNMDIYENMTTSMIDSKWDLIKNSSAVILDTNFPKKCISYFINRCRMEKILLYIDPVSVEKVYRLPHDLQGVNTIFPNKYEAQALTGIDIKNLDDCKLAALIILNKGVENVVITLGGKGVYYKGSYGELFLESISTKVKDVTGAGDSFLAGYLNGILNKCSVLESCKYGLAAAHLTIQTKDSTSCTLNDKNIKNVIKNIIYKTH